MCTQAHTLTIIKPITWRPDWFLTAQHFSTAGNKTSQSSSTKVSTHWERMWWNIPVRFSSKDRAYMFDVSFKVVSFNSSVKCTHTHTDCPWTKSSGRSISRFRWIQTSSCFISPRKDTHSQSIHRQTTKVTGQGWRVKVHSSSLLVDVTRRKQQAGRRCVCVCMYIYECICVCLGRRGRRFDVGEGWLMSVTESDTVHLG